MGSNGIWYCNQCHNSFKVVTPTKMIIKTKEKVIYSVQLLDIVNKLVKTVYGKDHINQCVGIRQTVLLKKYRNTIIEVYVPEEPYTQKKSSNKNKQCRNIHFEESYKYY